MFVPLPNHLPEDLQFNWSKQLVVLQLERWRNWLAQESYTLKVVGSIPILSTNMKQIISEYYRKKGFNVVYISTNKEPRRVATLRKQDGTMTSMAYAKYLYTSFYECDVANGDQVDHINGDRMDDRIENLQVISQHYNNAKDKPVKVLVERICPVCGEKFLFYRRNLPFRPNPCCSRRCGGIKSHW